MTKPSTESMNTPANTKAVNLRIRHDPLALIDRAAKSLGRSRSDFMIEASRRAAEDAILDQTVIMTDRESYDRFLALLDRAPESNDRLRKTMRTPAPWDAQ